jgi:ABC-type nitrate/sulfonate/bicarbonate transport system substrate-binding protein
MNRRQLLALCGLSSLAGCGRRNQPGAIRVSAGPYLYLSPLYLAIELGYFTEAGFAIDLHQLAHSAQSVPLLAGGALDVAFSAPNPAHLNAVGRGARIRFVAAQDYTTPACPGMGQLLVRRSAYPQRLPGLRDLRGRRVAIVNKAGLSEFSLDQVLGQAGMSSADVETAVLGPPEGIAALLSGEVDAVVTPDHYGKNPATVSPDLVSIAGLTDVLPGFAYSYVTFGKRMLDGDLDTGARFLWALLRAIVEYRKGRTPQFLEEFARSNGVDPTDARQLCRDTASPTGEFRLQTLQTFIDWSQRKGYCTEAVSAEDLIDPRYLAAAHELAGG